MSTRLLRSSRGMTVVELLVALVLAGLVLTAALDFLRQQGMALSAGTSKMTAVQNYRYALSTLRRDLRTVGTNVPASQPFLVYAGPDVVAFNADYASRDPGDLFAVYVDTAAPADQVAALRKPQRAQIPGTSFNYPDTSYTYRATNSPAETLVFFFRPDSTTTRADDFVLFRQVNRGAPAVVARNLLRTPGVPFFQYLRISENAAGATIVDSVRASSLPLRHTVKLHGVAADTGAAALIDRIRGVRVSLTASNGREGVREERRATSRLIRLPNAGMAALQTCGEEPALGSTLTAAAVALANGRRGISLAWGAAADEAGGEEDVLRYVIWRKQTAGGEWGDPFVSVPSGQAAYAFVDETVEPGAYYYALAAQDCSPALSALVGAGPVIVPNN